MNRARIAACVVLFVPCAVACSVLTSFDGLSTTLVYTDSGVSSDGPSNDASFVDAGFSDANDADMSALDASNDAPSYCNSISPVPDLCADFDEGKIVPPFQYVVQTGNGKLTLDTSSFTSAPVSFFATTQGSSGYPAAYAVWEAPKANELMTASFDIRVDLSDPHAATLAFLSFDTGANSNMLQLTFDGMSIRVNELVAFSDGGSTTTSHPKTTLSLSSWTRIVFRVALTPKPHAILTVGAQTIYSDEPLDSSWTVGPAKLGVGVFYAPQPDLPWNVRYDSVTFDVQ